MKTLYLELKMGAAGDMLTGALFSLLEKSQQDEFLRSINDMGIPGLSVHAEPSVKCGIAGTKIHVIINESEELPGGHIHHHHHDHDHGDGHLHHDHSALGDIKHAISHLNLPKGVRDHACDIYEIIADAESQAHGQPMDKIHFHEVGTMDAIADVVGFCLILNMIRPERIVASPVHVGSGQVHCAHGIMPVPTPATANILKDVPIYGGEVKGELCTPTGAAILKYFVQEYIEMPAMKIQGIGYGMGTKDFDRPNCVRAILADTEMDEGHNVVELSCNVDDMTGEEAGFALEAILGAGAREAFYEPVFMKKSRPGLKLTVITTEDLKETIVSVIFKHTTTIGIRECPMNRHVMTRSIEKVDTPYGKVRRKISRGYGIERDKLEYDDLAAIAREEGISISELKRIIETSASEA